MPSPNSQAAPPDDGHLGAFTRPSDVMVAPSSEADHDRHPALHVDTTKPSRPASLTPGIIAVTLTLLALAIIVALGLWPIRP